MSDHPNPRLEARSYALLTTRRALTQGLAGLGIDELWTPVADGLPAPGEIARRVWEQEAFWLWPPEIPPPKLEPRPALEGVLYALVRHRGVTEDLLFATTDLDLDRVYVSEARMGAEHEPVNLGDILETIMRDELFAAAELATLRRLIDPGWAGGREAWDNAARAVARSHAAG